MTSELKNLGVNVQNVEVMPTRKLEQNINIMQKIYTLWAMQTRHFYLFDITGQILTDFRYLFITVLHGSAECRHCCKGDERFQWEMPFFGV